MKRHWPPPLAQRRPPVPAAAAVRPTPATWLRLEQLAWPFRAAARVAGAALGAALPPGSVQAPGSVARELAVAAQALAPAPARFRSLEVAVLAPPQQVSALPPERVEAGAGISGARVEPPAVVLRRPQERALSEPVFPLPARAHRSAQAMNSLPTHRRQACPVPEPRTAA